MPGIIEITFVIVAILLVLSVVASKISDRFGVPALLVFLVIGMLAGSEGFGGIYFDDPLIAQAVGLFALAIILFSGGLDTKWEKIRSVVKQSLSLATLGVFLTAFLLGIAAHWVLGISLLEGMLLGAITSSTDAAAVFSLLRSQGIRLKGKLSSILEFESGSNDPMAVFLTISLIQLILMPEASPWRILLMFFQQMGLGALVGWASGKVLLYLINRLRLGYDGLYPVLVLGMLLLVISATNLIGGSGFLAIYLVGLILGKSDFLHKRSLSRFFEGLAWLMQIIMFLTLGLLVFPSRLIPIILPGMILALILIFVARPASVFLSLLPFRLPVREKVFISWVGLRGAVPIILATYPMIAGLDKAGLIFNVIFFVVLSSVLIQGTTITRLARWLKVDDTNEEEPRYPLELDPQQGWKGVLQEVIIQENSWAVGKAIFEMGLPMEYLVVMISRGDEFIIPNGSVVLQKNDRMLGLAKPEMHEQVTEILDHPKQTAPISTKTES